MPKYQVKPDIIRDQKTKPGTTNDNPVRSAKPPSPVQIRAAPPKFHIGKSSRLLLRGAISRAQVFPNRLLGSGLRVRKHLIGRGLRMRGVRKGGGFLNLRPPAFDTLRSNRPLTFV
jgi:hypothetical protein